MSIENYLMNILDVDALEERQHLRHPLANRLAEIGLDAKPSYENNRIFCGMLVRMKKSELTYKLKTSEVLILLMYRRIIERKGLMNSFEDLIWFVDMLAREELEIRWIIGTPKAFVNITGRDYLPGSKLVETYKTLWRAKSFGWKDNREWLYADLRDYLHPKECRRMSQNKNYQKPTLLGGQVMMKDGDLIEKTEEIIGKSEELIREAEGKIRESEEFYESIGIKKEKIKEYLDDRKWPEKISERLKQRHERFRIEMEGEMLQAEQKAKATEKPQTSSRRMKVRI